MYIISWLFEANERFGNKLFSSYDNVINLILSRIGSGDGGTAPVAAGGRRRH